MILVFLSLVSDDIASFGLVVVFGIDALALCFLFLVSFSML